MKDFHGWQLLAAGLWEYFDDEEKRLSIEGDCPQTAQEDHGRVFTMHVNMQLLRRDGAEPLELELYLRLFTKHQVLVFEDTEEEVFEAIRVDTEKDLGSTLIEILRTYVYERYGYL